MLKYKVTTDETELIVDMNEAGYQFQTVRLGRRVELLGDSTATDEQKATVAMVVHDMTWLAA